MSRVRVSYVSSQINGDRPDPATSAAWVVALVPAAPWLAALALVSATGGAIGLPVLAFLIAVSTGASVWAATADRAALVSRGFDDVADARWALVPLFYLSKRAKAFRDSYVANTPLWVHILVTPAAVLTFSVWANFAIRTN